MEKRPTVQIRNGWPVVQVGRLRHPVTILQQLPSSPAEWDAGGIIMNWVPFIPYAMSAIEVLSGTDLVRAGQTTSQTYADVILMYQPGIVAGMRVQTPSGSVFEIRDVKNINEMNAVLVLGCIGIGANN